jgi:tetratricopeptide (TPR) repeat protein
MPGGNKTFLGSSTLKGNSIYNFSYLIPRGYPSGLSTIRINFTDSKNRSYTLYLNFSTNITLLQPSLFVTPSFISITTIPKDVIERTITLENTADINATNIIKEISGIDMDADIPTSLAARQRIESVLRIDPRRLNEGSYTGKINLYSQVGDAEVTVSLEILGDLPSDASNKYAELVTLENNITFLSKMWVNTTDAALLLNQAKDTLNESISYYRAGDYETAKAKLEESLDMSNKLETEINNLYGKIPDNSYIIWYFAFAIVIVITTVTAIKVKGRRKKAKAAKKAVKEPSKEEIFFEPKGGEYRTEYY